MTERRPSAPLAGLPFACVMGCTELARPPIGRYAAWPAKMFGRVATAMRLR